MFSINFFMSMAKLKKKMVFTIFGELSGAFIFADYSGFFFYQVQFYEHVEKCLKMCGEFSCELI